MAIRRVPQKYTSVELAARAAKPGDTILIDGSYTGSKKAIIRDNGLIVDAPASVTGLVLKLADGIGKVTLKGGAGIEVQGNNLNNVITGNAGDNTFLGGAGKDKLKGGAGWDTADYRTATAAVAVNLATGKTSGGAGVDTLSSIEEVRGSNFSDRLTGNSGDNWLMGRRGDDRLNGGAGFDVADYRNATKAVAVNLATGKASGGDGKDILSNIEGVRGSNFNDTLTGNSGNNLLRGMKGNDKINGGAGFDRADYRNASGGVDVNLATGTATGADGNDTLISIEEVRGGDFSDTLTGNSLDNWFRGGLGNDIISGGGGFDTADYSDATGGVIANLATGNVSGAAGADFLSGIEDLRGGAFADTFTGDAFDNGFMGRGGDDVIDGAGGVDYVDYREAQGAVNVNLGTGVVTGADGNDTLSNIEDVRGSNFGDILTGGTGANWLRGMKGDDIIDGGDGNDWADYRNAGGSVNVNLTTGTSSGADGNDTLTNIERIRGSAFDDTLTGNAANNRFRGLTGNDTIDGGGGFDTASYRNATGSVTVNLVTGTTSGAEGFDTLTSIEAVEGSGFGDALIGNADSNTLTGGFGADTMTGGEGPDNFSYDAASEGGDTITDFAAADAFQFSRAGFGLGATGTTLGEVGAVFRSGATSANEASPSFIHDTGTGRLLFDADGTGVTNAPVLIATLSNGFALTADDLRFF